MISVYEFNPGLELPFEYRKNMLLAIQEVEQAAHILQAPNGPRIFDAYITTPPNNDRYAGDAYIIKTINPSIKKPKKRKRWWKRHDR